VIHHLQRDRDRRPKVVTKKNATNSSKGEQELAQTIGFMTRLPACALGENGEDEG
jgi:hypothetical protein